MPIRNGKVCFEKTVERADVLVENGRIADVGVLPDHIDGARVIDATRLFVLPGFIDIHTHLDDQIGRFYLADTYESGTRVAVQNGITTLFTFITQTPRDRSLSTAIRSAMGKAMGHCYCDYRWHMTRRIMAALKPRSKPGSTPSSFTRPTKKREFSAIISR